MEEALEQQDSDCLKVVVFGPESTGKTTLCRDLADYFETPWVPEYMRLYLENKIKKSGTAIEQEDLLPIARGQMKHENLAAQESSLLFCDTDLLQLKVYSEYYYDGYCPPELTAAAIRARYDCYLLCDIDVPWEADQLRDRPFDRKTLFRIFRAELTKNDRVFHLVTGGREERLRQAVAIVDNLRESAC